MIYISGYFFFFLKEVSLMYNYNQKHLNLDQRMVIQTGIVSNSTFKAIASIIAKDPTTVKKEILRHRTLKPGSHYNQEPAFKCSSFNHCSLPSYNVPALCNHSCSDFKLAFCKRRDKSPCACNGCLTSRSCRTDKFIYDAKAAQLAYEETLVDSRVGVNLSYSQAKTLSEVIAPLIKNGHSPAHILMNHPEICLSEKTIYSYIDNNILPGLINADLRKKVAYKPRKSHKVKRSSSHFDGHTYSDFAAFLDKNPFSHIVELDSVEGCEGKSGKILHTILFIDQNFLVAFLSNSSTAYSSVSFFDYLQKKLNTPCFIDFFYLVLTDRGSEFSSIHDLEYDSNNIQRSHVFYCDAMHSWDKGALENAHHYIRYFLPKGTSFSSLTQDKVNLMISHINSSPRKSLNGKTPYDAMEVDYGDYLMRKLSIRRIEKDQVILTPALIK